MHGEQELASRSRTSPPFTVKPVGRPQEPHQAQGCRGRHARRSTTGRHARRVRGATGAGPPTSGPAKLGGDGATTAPSPRRCSRGRLEGARRKKQLSCAGPVWRRACDGEGSRLLLMLALALALSVSTAGFFAEALSPPCHSRRSSSGWSATSRLQTCRVAPRASRTTSARLSPLPAAGRPGRAGELAQLGAVERPPAAWSARRPRWSQLGLAPAPRCPGGPVRFLVDVCRRCR
jgi:hypothetical protein